MRKSIFLYLFVFSALLVVFEYVNATRMLKGKDHEIQILEQKLSRISSENDSLQRYASSTSYFSFESNESAISYFEEMGLDSQKVSEKIKDELIGANKSSEDNSFVPYAGMEGKMRINKIKILNHKWILADFTDGTYWGELFITYYFDKNKKLILTPENSFLYPRD